MVAKESPRDGPPPPDDPQEPHDPHAKHEGATALRNGVKLLLSLALTWAVSLIMAFKPQNYLGPVSFGWFQYGSQYALSLAASARLRW